jgi:hypothetical protein
MPKRKLAGGQREKQKKPKKTTAQKETAAANAARQKQHKLTLEKAHEQNKNLGKRGSVICKDS